MRRFLPLVLPDGIPIGGWFPCFRSVRLFGHARSLVFLEGHHATTRVHGVAGRPWEHRRVPLGEGTTSLHHQFVLFLLLFGIKPRDLIGLLAYLGRSAAPANFVELAVVLLRGQFVFCDAAGRGLDPDSAALRRCGRQRFFLAGRLFRTGTVLGVLGSRAEDIRLRPITRARRFDGGRRGRIARQTALTTCVNRSGLFTGRIRRTVGHSSIGWVIALT